MPVSFDILFREAQQRVLQYHSGKMAIIAVPGSGKTFILTRLAASLVNRMSPKDIERGRETLLVTFSNSAVKTLQNRIEPLLESRTDQQLGYRIRTLHGLARDIISERPTLVGLTDDFRILDEQVSQQIVQEATLANLPSYADFFDDFIATSIRADEKRMRQINERSLPDLAVQICRRFIKHCKDHALLPDDLNNKALEAPILQFTTHVYADYQRRLAYRSAVDFDDLVMLALRALQENETLRIEAQKRWMYILEDEAQDSSLLQEKLLRLLSADKNWVRVGDPNQSINSTFTTASPEFLRAFTQEKDVTTILLNQSGRSGRPIIDFANALVKWGTQVHPVKEVRKALDSRMIEAVQIGDPNPNPPMSETNVHIYYQPGKDISPEQELQVVMHSLQRWLPENPGKTVALLVPENRHGYQFAEMLRLAGIPFDELLRTTADIRQAVKALLIVLNYLCDPFSANLLAIVYRDVWWSLGLGQTSEVRSKLGADQIKPLINNISKTLNQFKNVEDFLYPLSDDNSWMQRFSKLDPRLQPDLKDFRQQLQHWLNGFYLPPDQLLLMIGRDIFRETADLTITYQLASFLRSFQDLEMPRSLRDLTAELRAISENQRRYLDYDEVAVGYQPKSGVPTISTLHASKGLEWDRVYILGINSRSFPEGKETDGNYVSERWFVRDQLNMEAEITAILDTTLNESPYEEGNATQNARIAYASERMRLLYVGITRAKHEVILLWNMGYQWRQTSTVAEPALALKSLQEYLDGSLSF